MRSRCPRSDCNGHTFEIEQFEPRGSAFKLIAVQCASCGAVVGVIDYMNIGNILGKIAEKLGIRL